jgi:hypothetical protein
LLAVSDAPPEDPRDALIREQAVQLEAQAEQITALEALVADLREQVAAAERAQVAEQRDTPRCRRQPMTCRDGSRPGSSGGLRNALRRRSGEAARQPGHLHDVGGPGPDWGSLPGRTVPVRP